MVDTVDLRRSEFYFTVIEILRISADWIRESMDSLHQTVNDMERLYLCSIANGQSATFCPPTSQDPSGAAIRVFRKNWQSVISQQQRVGDALLSRIDKQLEDTPSLRDGVRLP